MNKKNKERLYSHFSYEMYRYAPESFRLFYNNVLIKLNPVTQRDMGNALITGGKAEVLKHIKKWVRRQSTMSLDQPNPILAIVSKDGKEFYHIGVPVDRYEIQTKLWIFKAIKEAFTAGRFAIKTHTAKLDAYGKPYNIQEKQEEKRLGNRVIFV